MLESGARLHGCGAQTIELCPIWAESWNPFPIKQRRVIVVHFISVFIACT